jgi:murein DD-endopeptidase MepM/ murein hydrolase activator NlpD
MSSLIDSQKVSRRRRVGALPVPRSIRVRSGPIRPSPTRSGSIPSLQPRSGRVPALQPRSGRAPAPQLRLPGGRRWDGGVALGSQRPVRSRPTGPSRPSRALRLGLQQPLPAHAAARAPRGGRPAPDRSRRPADGPALRVVRRIFGGGASRIELVLAAVLLAGVLVPALMRMPFLESQSRAILMPDAADAESVLFRYLVPEEFQGVGPTDLHPDAVQTVQTRSYKVRSGDTISEIAQRFGLNMDTVISYNGIQDARALREGSVLALPNADGLKYRVRRGDNLDGIARRHGVALNELLDWNDLDSALIVPGQELFIPGARLSEMERNRVFGRLFIYPTIGRITSRFGVRSDPITGLRRFHNGVDLANAVGTPVVAAMSGRVAMLGYNPNFGKYIIISHPEGYQTLYGHLSQFLVQKGQRVGQGHEIARMGNTGYSTGSHLHFSIFKRGEPVDPFRYLH